MKFFIQVLAAASGTAITYFAANIFISLGDLRYIVAQNPMVLMLAIIVTLVPFAVAWGGFWLIGQKQTTRSQVVAFLATHIPAWGWLYIGSIYLALQRLQ